MASVEIMRTYLDHITAGEFEAAMGYWADDIVVHVSGNNLTSGTYTGKEAAAGWAAQAVGVALVLSSVLLPDRRTRDVSNLRQF